MQVGQRWCGVRWTRPGGQGGGTAPTPCSLTTTDVRVGGRTEASLLLPLAPFPHPWGYCNAHNPLHTHGTPAQSIKTQEAPQATPRFTFTYLLHGNNGPSLSSVVPLLFTTSVLSPGPCRSEKSQSTPQPAVCALPPPWHTCASSDPCQHLPGDDNRELAPTPRGTSFVAYPKLRCAARSSVSPLSPCLLPRANTIGRASCGLACPPRAILTLLVTRREADH